MCGVQLLLRILKLNMQSLHSYSSIKSIEAWCDIDMRNIRLKSDDTFVIATAKMQTVDQRMGKLRNKRTSLKSSCLVSSCLIISDDLNIIELY